MKISGINRDGVKRDIQSVQMSASDDGIRRTQSEASGAYRLAVERYRQHEQAARDAGVSQQEITAVEHECARAYQLMDVEPLLDFGTACRRLNNLASNAIGRDSRGAGAHLSVPSGSGDAAHIQDAAGTSGYLCADCGESLDDAQPGPPGHVQCASCGRVNSLPDANSSDDENNDDAADADALDETQGAGVTDLSDDVDVDLAELQCAAPVSHGTKECGGSLTTTDDPMKARCVRCGALNDLTPACAEPPNDGTSLTEVIDCRCGTWRLRDREMPHRCPRCLTEWSIWNLRSHARRQLAERLARPYRFAKPTL